MTTVAIHQPNYLPASSYFEKIAQSDVFVFLDNVQYSKGGYTNRNRIKSTGARGWQWLTVPIVREGSSHGLVKDIEISNIDDWYEKHWKTICQNYSKSPFFDDVAAVLRGAYSHGWTWLADLNEDLILGICGLMGIKTRFIRSSDLSVSGKRTSLLLDICEAVGADTYLSGVGALRYMDEGAFAERRIRVEVQQKYEGPSPRLSVIDGLFDRGGGLSEVLQLGTATLR